MSHENSGKSDEWYTPKYVFDALETIFDLDVASPESREYCSVPAQTFISKNSLDKLWSGFVWMNPPFGNQNTKFQWIGKFISHGNGVALMPDRTSASWWQHFAKNSDAILLVDKKIKFINPKGLKGESPSNGTTLFAIGKQGVKSLQKAESNRLGIMYTKQKL